MIGLFLGLATGLLLRYTLGSSTTEIKIPLVVPPGELGPLAVDVMNAPTDDRLIDESSIRVQNGTIKRVNGYFEYRPNLNWHGTDQIEYSAVDPHGQAKSLVTTWIKPFGDAFVRLIKMLIIPLIATTLVAGVTAMGDPKRLGLAGAPHDWSLFADHPVCGQPGVGRGDGRATRSGGQLPERWC